MNKELATNALVFAILLSLLLITLPIIPTSRAWNDGTIYVRSDGSIEPLSAPIQQNGTLYTLTDDISSNLDGIVIEKNSITLNGAGHIIQASGTGIGINLTSVNNVTIIDTRIKEFYHGIFLNYSDNNCIYRNDITSNHYGISLYSSTNNNIFGNNITNNAGGIRFDASSANRFHYNNAINNTRQILTYDLTNDWDDGYPSGGNYWSDHNHEDNMNGSLQNETGNDGIGDTPYIIDPNNQDHYPLVGQYNTLIADTLNETDYRIDIVSNSTVSNFEFSSTEKDMSFNVTNSSPATGFCRVTIPDALLTSPYTIRVDDSAPPVSNQISNGTHTYAYFAYDSDAERVRILGHDYVNEPPVAALAVNNTNPLVNETVTFDATASYDTDGHVQHYFFDFGDQSDSGWTSSPIIFHTYTNPGTYNATVTVEDDVGATSIQSDETKVQINVIIPEFQSLQFLGLFMITTLMLATVYLTKRRKKSLSQIPSQSDETSVSSARGSSSISS